VAGALDRDMLLRTFRTWVEGVEGVGDAEQLGALLVRNEVSLANIGLFSVDELVAMGVDEDAAVALLSAARCIEASVHTSAPGTCMSPNVASGMPGPEAR
jgi:hypothetical protein